MMVKISLEFKSVDEAIVALGKLVGAQTAKRIAPAATGDTTPTAASIAVPPVSAAPATSRKPRADKGAKRGAYKDRIELAALPPIATMPQPIPVVASATAHHDAAETSGNALISATDPSNGAQLVAPTLKSTSEQAPNGAQPAPATNATPGTTLEQAQAAMEKVYKAKGVDVAKQILARLGTNRVKDILPASLGLFVKMATDIASFPEEQNSPAFAAKLQAYFAQ
jgi:hypothetical protein